MGFAGGMQDYVLLRRPGCTWMRGSLHVVLDFTQVDSAVSHPCKARQPSNEFFPARHSSGPTHPQGGNIYCVQSVSHLLSLILSKSSILGNATENSKDWQFIHFWNPDLNLVLSSFKANGHVNLWAAESKLTDKLALWNSTFKNTCVRRGGSILRL